MSIPGRSSSKRPLRIIKPAPGAFHGFGGRPFPGGAIGNQPALSTFSGGRSIVFPGGRRDPLLSYPGEQSLAFRREVRPSCPGGRLPCEQDRGGGLRAGPRARGHGAVLHGDAPPQAQEHDAFRGGR